MRCRTLKKPASAMRLSWRTTPETTVSTMTMLTDLMRAVSSSNFPGREGWKLMFHVEHQLGLWGLTVHLWLWTEPHTAADP